MEGFERKKLLLKGKMDRRQLRLQTALEDNSLDIDEALLEWEEIFRQIDANYDNILEVCQPDKMADILDELAAVEKSYHDLRTKLKNSQPSNRSTVSTPASGSACSHPQYEKQRLGLPKFSGKQEEWTQYSALFVDGMNRYTNLSDAEKLQFLVESLSGEAKEVIACFATQPKAYELAWTALTEEYDRPLDNTFATIDNLLNLPVSNHPKDLKLLFDTATRTRRQLQVMQYSLEGQYHIWNRLITSKMDIATYKLWRSRQRQDSKPATASVLEFLREQSQLEPVYASSSSQQQNKGNTTKAHVAQKCPDPQCKLEHPLYRCPSYLAAHLDEKWFTVKRIHVCTNCLKTTHATINCPSAAVCRQCSKRHHTTLHRETKSVAAAVATSGDVPTTASAATGDVLLATAMISILNGKGQPIKLRAMLDTGAQLSLISDSANKKLNLSTQANSTGLTLAGGQTSSSHEVVKCAINSETQKFSILASLHVVPMIVQQLPATEIDQRMLKALTQGKTLADPQYHSPAAIDILIGADLYPAILENEVCTNGFTIAQNTKFGWVIIGPTHPTQDPLKKRVVTNVTIFRKFWEVEELPAQRHLTVEEQQVGEFMKKNTFRNENGKFVMKMPLKSDPPDIGASRQMAIARLRALERKFSKQPDFAKSYKDVISEYIEHGHLEPTSQVHSRVSYIPHHAVVREHATTTKLRVVFDASAKTSNGVSLNDCQANGPRLQDDIFTILVRFRLYPVALTADISKMYRQVWLNDSDRDLQRIVWREQPNQPIQDLRLTTVTFGQKAAPYMAVKALQLLSESVEDPEVARVMKNDFYVDDLLSGAPTPAEASNLQAKLQKHLLSGGFPSHKWASNSPAALQNVSQDERATTLSLDSDTNETIKTLGIQWNTVGDMFSVKVTKPSTTNWTRRSVLSTANSVFDPLGWLAPVTVCAKLQLQRIIQETSDWDEPLSHEQLKIWTDWCNLLSNLETIVVPRCISPHQAPVTLCGFSDASEKAYGAVIYARTVNGEDGALIRLVASKTRVAPLRPITIPRLELLGAHLLSQLMTTVAKALQVPIQRCLAWTDSTITLAWIRAHPSRWQTFVANRVMAIQESIPATQWQHVRGEENPADISSRGVLANELSKSKLWWQGPSFLQVGVESGSDPQPVVPPEEKRSTPANPSVVASISAPAADTTALLHSSSSYAKLRRVVAIVIAFTDKALKRTSTARPTTNQLLRADATIARWVQEASFGDEMACLRINKPVQVQSRLAPLNPLLRSDGVIVVGGRLKNATVQESAKHQVILPSSHHVTKLLVNDVHQRFLHAGQTVTESQLREKYWILKQTLTVKNVLRKCTVCTRNKAQTANQMMADLPAARVTPSRPFTNTGVDFAGPVELRTELARGSKTYKAWIAVFVCFATRAIHLELVRGLSAEAFQAALTRFVSRRGLPANMYSDQGTNFMRASREISVFISSAPLQGQGLQWHFNPPSAPHFGGLWEAGVKSMKVHLKKVIGKTRLNFEEYTTILCRVEAVLNSRPLVPLNQDPWSLKALTPAHFLIGGNLHHTPEEDLKDCEIHTLRRWQHVQKISQDFWSRWSREYVTRLQQRPKWWRLQPSIKEGSMVLIHDKNRSPLDWRLGRVVTIHPGTDGLVRVVTVKTAYGEVQRPITKLCLLPLDGDEMPAEQPAETTTVDEIQDLSHGGSEVRTSQDLSGGGNSQDLRGGGSEVRTSQDLCGGGSEMDTSQDLSGGGLKLCPSQDLCGGGTSQDLCGGGSEMDTSQDHCDGGSNIPGSENTDVDADGETQPPSGNEPNEMTEDKDLMTTSGPDDTQTTKVQRRRLQMPLRYQPSRKCKQ